MAIQIFCKYQTDDDLAKVRAALEPLALDEYQESEGWRGYYKEIKYFDHVTLGQTYKIKQKILAEIRRQQQNAETSANDDAVPEVVMRNRGKYNDD